MTITIKTNNVPRETLMFCQLNEKEKELIEKQFDYFSEEELEEQYFFKFKRYWYCLSDFLRVENTEFKDWDGYHSDSYFSGVLIKVKEGFMGDYDVVCGTYCS